MKTIEDCAAGISIVCVCVCVCVCLCVCVTERETLKNLTLRIAQSMLLYVKNLLYHLMLMKRYQEEVTA